VSFLADAAAQLGDGQAGTKADLQDPVGGLHLKQRDHAAVALAVGGRCAITQPATFPAAPRGVMTLANDVVIQDTHRGKSKALNRALDAAVTARFSAMTCSQRLPRGSSARRWSRIVSP
jgi:hypothetical protein